MGLLANLTFVAILGSGLMAGVFFAFSTFVMGALRDLPPEAGLAAMRRIDARATRSLFVAVFLAMAGLSVHLAANAYLRLGQGGLAYLVLGGLVYVVGVFGTTVVGNLRLSRRLDSAEDSALWPRDLAAWMLWNHTRTLAALGALALFTLSLLDQSHAVLART